MKHTHKLRHPEAAGKELASLLGLDLFELACSEDAGDLFRPTPEKYLEDVWACYLSVTQISYRCWVDEAPEEHTFENWSFGLPDREAQLAGLAKGRLPGRPRKGPQFAR